MAVGNLLTELGSAIVAFLQTFLPGVVEAFVGTFDALAFTGEGDAAIAEPSSVRRLPTAIFETS